MRGTCRAAAIAAILVVVLGAGAAGGSAGGTSPFAGTWSILDYGNATAETEASPDTWTFVPTAPGSNSYKVTSSGGWSATVSIGPKGGGGTLTFRQEGATDKNAAYIFKVRFTVSPGGATSLSGKWTRTELQTPLWHKVTGLRNGPPIPTPALSLSISPQSATVQVGKEIKETITVTAGAEALTGVNLYHGLDLATKAAEVTQAPSGLSGFSLAAGATRRFVFTVVGASEGKSGLSAHASGQSATKTVSSSARATITVRVAGPTSIDWVMPERTTENTVESTREGIGLPDASWVSPAKWRATLFTREGSNRFACGSDTRFVWEVKPAKNLVGGKQPPVACSPDLDVTEQGTYMVAAQMQKRLSGAWRDVGKPLSGKVRITDWLIVGMGDSNGSGEGNPPFYNLRCNRSVESYQVQTALTVEKNDPHSSVTFIHTSCSGARVEHLMTATYAGTRPASPALPPQIDQIVALLADHPKGQSQRKVDVALISAGVNDLAFGPVLAYCIQHVGLGDPSLFRPSTWSPPSEASITANPCQKRLVVGIPEQGGTRVGSFVDDPKPDPLSQTLAVRVARLQQDLKTTRFQGLSAALGKIGVRPDHVFLAKYPDFSHDDHGKTCGFSGAARLPPSTWAWLSQQSVLLNEAVSAAAARYHWNVAAWSAKAFLNHGYCAKGSYIRAILDATLNPYLKTSLVGGYPILLQPYADAAGPFHPTAKGHEIEAGGTLPSVCRKLYSGDATCDAPK